MSILGAVIRTPAHCVNDVVERLQGCAGVELALNPGDGRLVVVIEDTEVAQGQRGAAAQLAAISGWPEVLSASLVYEYSGPDAPAPADAQGVDFTAWRRSLAELASPEPNAP